VRKERKEKMDKEVTAGETTIDDSVVASIAGLAAGEIEGVAHLGKSLVRSRIAEVVTGAEGKARQGVSVTVGHKEATVDLQLDVIYGFNIPTIITKVRKMVATRLLEIAGLVAKEINVRIVGIEFPEKAPEKGKKIQ
jgi:uncharacterized alkaline shock family protein YloU